jgi:hypothetical protein
LTKDPSTQVPVYNSYVPPKWRVREFYLGEPIEPLAACPPLYQRFLDQLTNGHIESREYVLDWLANSLRARNYTVLTAIGEEGVGKGLLGKIMHLLHGEKNFQEARDTVFKEKFNGQLANKTLVHVDEIDLKDKESHDRIKAIVNDTLEIERKGHDAVAMRNWASFYIASNSKDAIQLGGGDRRYSVIELTETKLVATPLFNELGALLNSNNISELARHLRCRHLSFNMMVPFRSRNFDVLRSATLTDWELFVIEELAPRYSGTTQELSHIQNLLEEEFARSLKRAPGWRKFEALHKKYPELLKVSKVGQRWKLLFT